MSRQESDREDLLREATALVERVELSIPDESDPIVVGFRRNGCLSFFFGVDSVFQFNTAGELRRLYYGEKLLKAEEGSLVALRRERAANETVLWRTEVSSSQQTEICLGCERRLSNLQQILEAGRYQLVGQIPADGAVIPRILAWFNEHPAPRKVALTPNAT